MLQRLLNVCKISSLLGNRIDKTWTGQHQVRGATKEKSKKLDELKARRRAKDDKKRVSLFLQNMMLVLMVS